MRSKRGKKIACRIKRIDNEAYEKLLCDLPYLCSTCVHNSQCTEIKNVNDTTGECSCYEMAYDVYELQSMLKEQNVNISSFCKDYNLKLHYFQKMISGSMLFSYRYYKSIIDRCMEKESFLKYEDRFKENNMDCIDRVGDCE